MQYTYLVLIDVLMDVLYNLGLKVSYWEIGWLRLIGTFKYYGRALLVQMTPFFKIYIKLLSIKYMPPNIYYDYAF